MKPIMFSNWHIVSGQILKLVLYTLIGPLPVMSRIISSKKRKLITSWTVTQALMNEIDTLLETWSNIREVTLMMPTMFMNSS